MISDLPKPFIFVHIPKNGGSSIENALAKHAAGRPQFEGELSTEELIRLALPAEGFAFQHKQLDWFEQQGCVDGRFVFTVVRNPFDRAVSQIRYLQSNSERGREVFKYRSWSDNLVVLAETNEWIWGQDLGACQVDYLTLRSGKIGCDMIIKFESLLSQWEEICQALGFQHAPTLPRDNSSHRIPPYREFYDDRAYEAVRQKYKRDCEAFGYGF